MHRRIVLLAALLASSLHADAAGRKRAVLPAPLEVSLDFTFDAGFRVIGATNPQPASIR